MKGDPDFIGLILAGRSGARLFPLTTDVGSVPPTTTTTTIQDGTPCADQGTLTGDATNDNPVLEHGVDNNEIIGSSSSNVKDEDGSDGEDPFQQYPQGAALVKHLLPLAGCPVICRLLHTIEESSDCSSLGGLARVVVAVAEHDEQTLKSIKRYYKVDRKRSYTCQTNHFHYTKPSFDTNKKILEKSSPASSTTVTVVSLLLQPEEGDGSSGKSKKSAITTAAGDDQENSGPGSSTNTTTCVFQIDVVHLNAECVGSADAVRFVTSLTTVGGSNKATSSLIPKQSNIMLLPGDLILEGKGMLGLLADAHRRNACVNTTSSTTATTSMESSQEQYGAGPSSCCASVGSITMLLSDVGEDDENGLPLKESAKQKKGSLARDEEDIEFMALSNFQPNFYLLAPNITTTPSLLPLNRLLFKRCKIDLEDQAKETGDTPKLSISKAALVHSGSGGNGSRIVFRSDLEDVHLYVLSPWVVALIQARCNLSSIQKEVLPLLTVRQFNAREGLQGTFGRNITNPTSSSSGSEGGAGGTRHSSMTNISTRNVSIGSVKAASAVVTPTREERFQQHKRDVLRGVMPLIWKQIGEAMMFSDHTGHSLFERRFGDDILHNSDDDGNNHNVVDDKMDEYDGEGEATLGSSEYHHRHHNSESLDRSERGMHPTQKDWLSCRPLPFHVSAIVVPRGPRMILRAFTVNHYSYACREFIAHAAKPALVNNQPLNPVDPSQQQSNNSSELTPELDDALRSSLRSCFILPEGGGGGKASSSNATAMASPASAANTTGGSSALQDDVPLLDSKFFTLQLSTNTTRIGEKVTMKSTTIGRHCDVGKRSRLNNVVAMDHVTIGENCVLQNSVIAYGASIGDNCNLNDVQVGPGAHVAAGTKTKGEGIVSGSVADVDPLLLA